jgi:hypothetical protein
VPWVEVPESSPFPSPRPHYPTIVRLASSLSRPTYIHYVSACEYGDGDQVFNNYGPKVRNGHNTDTAECDCGVGELFSSLCLILLQSNEELLFGYGFVDVGRETSSGGSISVRRNPHNHVPLAMGSSMCPRARALQTLFDLPRLHFLRYISIESLTAAFCGHLNPPSSVSSLTAHPPIIPGNPLSSYAAARVSRRL